MGLLNPYALLIGVLGLAMLAFHGARYIVLKSPGDLGERAKKWSTAAGSVYLVLFLLASAVTLATQPHLAENYASWPILWSVPVLALASIAMALYWGKKDRQGKAFFASSLSIAGMMGITGASLFPRLVPALGNPELSLTASNSSSSELTLMVMLILALVGVPLVLGYTIWVYRAFAGKVDIDRKSNHY